MTPPPCRELALVSSSYRVRLSALWCRPRTCRQQGLHTTDVAVETRVHERRLPILGRGVHGSAGREQ